MSNIVRTTRKTHDMSWHPNYSAWIWFLKSCRKKGIVLPPEVLDYETFRALRPTPQEVLEGKNDASVGILDPSKPPTLENIGWRLRKVRNW